MLLWLLTLLALPGPTVQATLHLAARVAYSAADAKQFPRPCNLQTTPAAHHQLRRPWPGGPAKLVGLIALRWGLRAWEVCNAVLSKGGLLLNGRDGGSAQAVLTKSLGALDCTLVLPVPSGGAGARQVVCLPRLFVCCIYLYAAADAAAAAALLLLLLLLLLLMPPPPPLCFHLHRLCMRVHLFCHTCCIYLPPPGPDSAALTLTTALVCFLHPHPHPLHFHALPVLHALPCCLLWAEPVGSTSGLDVSLATHTGRVCLLVCLGILKSVTVQ